MNILQGIYGKLLGSRFNNLKRFGRWSFVEFCDVCQIGGIFESKVEEEVNKMIDAVAGDS